MMMIEMHIFWFIVYSVVLVSFSASISYAIFALTSIAPDKNLDYDCEPKRGQPPASTWPPTTQSLSKNGGLQSEK
jgi:hypothetical protein